MAGARDPALNEVCQELRQEIHASAAETRRYSEALAAETRRHFDVVSEGMLSKVQLVAEGLVALDEKVERFHDEIRREFKKVDRRLLRLEAR
ncbi:MAG: hypothetical protein HY215_09445 [Candidatus Rokubacteria bacterium]|nr:hypothetical protein [Candidatus Rokubacteria bacterium]